MAESCIQTVLSKPASCFETLSVVPLGLSFLAGDVYIGEMRMKLRHGEGILKAADGSEFIGVFENDYLTGKGTIRTPKHEYFGMIVNSMPHVRFRAC